MGDDVAELGAQIHSPLQGLSTPSDFTKIQLARVLACGSVSDAKDLQAIAVESIEI